MGIKYANGSLQYYITGDDMEDLQVICGSKQWMSILLYKYMH